MLGHVPERRRGLSSRQPVLCAPDEPSKDKKNTDHFINLGFKAEQRRQKPEILGPYVP